MSRRRKQPKKIEPGAGPRYAPWAVCIFLFVAVAVVFGQTLRHDFVNYDDNDYVYENSHVMHGLTPEAVAWAMTTGHASNWHPLTWLSHELDCQVFGLRPGGHHATSVLLHAATAILLFLVLWRMTGDLWPSAFVAAVFAVHPLRVESVAWVAERKDVLSGLFFMLTLAAYLHYVRQPNSPRRYLLVLLVFALGLMSKPMLVTTPFVLLLLDYWPLGRMTARRVDFPDCRVGENGTVPFVAAIPLRLIVEKIPLLLLTAVSCVVTSIVQSDALAKMQKLSLSSRVDNALVSCVAYIGQLFWPVDLAVFYPHPGDDLAGWKVAASLLALVGLSAGALACWRRIPGVTVGWLWYLGMLVPVIGLVQVGSQAQADRYTYLPQIGLLICLAWGAMYAAKSWPSRRWAFGVASTFAIAALMACAWHQTSFWSNSETLWNRALACTSNNCTAHVNLGAVLTTKGDLDNAVQHLRRALEIEPANVDAHVDLGEAFAKLKRFDDAIAQYRLALQTDPACSEAHYNLAVAWARIGRLDEAMPEYEQTLKFNPDCAEAHANLGVALQLRGRIGDATGHFRQALVLATQQGKTQLADDLKARLRQIAGAGFDGGQR